MPPLSALAASSLTRSLAHSLTSTRSHTHSPRCPRTAARCGLHHTHAASYAQPLRHSLTPRLVRCVHASAAEWELSRASPTRSHVQSNACWNKGRGCWNTRKIDEVLHIRSIQARPLDLGSATVDPVHLACDGNGSGGAVSMPSSTQDHCSLRACRCSRLASLLRRSLAR